MAVKGLSWREARRALVASGLSPGATLSLIWPFGRSERARAMLRHRRSLLEAKNSVVDYLSRAQRGAASLALRRSEDPAAALQDPEKQQLAMAAGISRAMMEEELAARYGSEIGRALDTALAELVSEGVVLEGSPVPGSRQVVYMISEGGRRRRWDVSELTRLLGTGRDYGAELRGRLRQEETTGAARTHRL